MQPITLSHIRIPYKNSSSSCLRISCHGNNRILVLLPGRTLPADAFFNINIFSNTSIADLIVDLGYDVAFFDPVGFGDSRGIVNELYLRDKLAEQLIDVVSILEQQYSKIYVQGFCTTYHVPLIAAQSKKSINGIVLMSPYGQMLDQPDFEEFIEHYQEYRKGFIQSNFFRHASIPWLQKHHDFSDTMVCEFKNNPKRATKIPNWGDLVENYLKNFKRFKHFSGWFSPEDMIQDPYLFDNLYNTIGWDIKKIDCPIAVIRGELDFEFLISNGQDVINDLLPNVVSNIEVVGASHFGMWDIVNKEWTNNFLESLRAVE